VALALYVAGDPAPAVRAVAALAALYARGDHATCMEQLIGASQQLFPVAVSHPLPASQGEGYDSLTCAPVRFEARTGDRTDPWSHMQLDALGLFLAAYGTFAQAGLLAPDSALLSRFCRYLAAICYWERPDLGHWEEWPAVVRTSSLGCCVAGLRAVSPLLRGVARSPGPPCAAESGAACWAAQAEHLASLGAEQLVPRLGGAGADQSAWETEGRADDAALLTLLLPPLASQLGLTRQQRDSIVASALRLRRPHGVLRYENDSYYGADYQLRLRRWKARQACDHSAYPDRAERDSWAVPRCEAQWTIFEPLLLLHFLERHLAGEQRAEGAPPVAAGAGLLSAAEARRSLMRVLAAIEEEVVGGDVRLHVHESYVVTQGRRGPNDVQDLLWAVAYVRMALAQVEDALR
jgi:hypothetical protein